MRQAAGKHPFFERINRSPFRFSFFKKTILINGCTKSFGQVSVERRDNAGTQNNEISIHLNFLADLGVFFAGQRVEEGKHDARAQEKGRDGPGENADAQHRAGRLLGGVGHIVGGAQKQGNERQGAGDGAVALVTGGWVSTLKRSLKTEVETEESSQAQ